MHFMLDLRIWWLKSQRYLFDTVIMLGDKEVKCELGLDFFFNVKKGFGLLWLEITNKKMWDWILEKSRAGKWDLYPSS